MLLFSEPPFSKRTLCFKHKMADLNYDFSMNQLKNRLETFKDWPFTEETGSSCTAQKVIGCFDCSKNYFATNRLSLALQRIDGGRCQRSLNTNSFVLDA